MADFLDILVRDAEKTIAKGYYKVDDDRKVTRHLSLKDTITKCKHVPIITEIKPSSPSHGNLRIIKDVRDIAGAMERGGASGISVLTEPKYFSGSIEMLKEVKRTVNLPVLMKDIIIDPVQIEAASKIGADAILLIFSVFRRGYVGYSVQDMIKIAHSKRLEVLLETHDAAEFLSALETEADLVGINNRNLETLKVDLEVTRQIMSVVGECGKVVVSESGIQKPEDIRFLRACGVKAFLIGSAIMLANNIEEKVRELVHAL